MKIATSSLDSSRPGHSLCPPPNGVKVLLLTAAPIFCMIYLKGKKKTKKEKKIRMQNSDVLENYNFGFR